MSKHPPAMLDTDTLSLLMRRDPAVATHAQDYLKERPIFTFSIITRYEILRGLKAKRATIQLQAFEKFCDASDIIGISDDVITKHRKFTRIFTKQAI